MLTQVTYSYLTMPPGSTIKVPQALFTLPNAQILLKGIFVPNSIHTNMTA